MFLPPYFFRRNEVWCVIRVFLQKYFILPILFVLSVSGAVPLAPARADGMGNSTKTATESLIDNGGYAVKKNNRYIAEHNLHTLYIPASTIKIATALATLDLLGPSYRFETFFYRDIHDNLYIKGFGDPFLISEEVAVIVRKLKELGCTTINNIYLDSTAFAQVALTDGAGASDNPYDAQNSALAVNFNTIHIRKDQGGTVFSAEEQTPTLPFMEKLAEALDPGVHRVNISQEKDSGHDFISRYVGELFRAFQQQENIAGEGIITRRKTPEDLMVFYSHQSSKTLEDIIGPLMLYSNNFIANQLFLALGAQKYNYPATWEKSMRAMADYLHKKYNLAAKDIRIFEGSGLSRKNRVSPHAMLQLLDSFKSYANLLPQEDGRLLKSGTLQGVYCYAGYFRGNGGLDSFVLLLNQGKNNRDRVLDALERLYHDN